MSELKSFELRIGTSVEKPFGVRFFEVVEVMYNAKNKAIAWSVHTPLGESALALKEDIKQMQAAFKLPIIDLDDFPNIYFERNGQNLN